MHTMTDLPTDKPAAYAELETSLRALLEDPRFDPPLQPREIAVLAPDIDPYAPYLDAVFGGTPGQAIPYAIADASPLAGEPLADVRGAVLFVAAHDHGDVD